MNSKKKISIHTEQCSDLRVNDSMNPVGIDDECIRLTWRLPETAAFSDVDRVQIRCALRGKDIKQGGSELLWDSGVKPIDCPNAMNAMNYSGPALPPCTRIYWSVRVWTKTTDEPCDWAAVAYWESGLGCSETNWEGSRWIAHVVKTPRQPLLHCELLRSTFALPDKPVKRARLYVATPAFFLAWLNQDAIQAIPCDPIPSRSDKRIYYRTLDIGEYLSSGIQVLGLRLASGCYSPVHTTVEHPFPVVRVLLHVEFEDGEVFKLGSDEKWRTTEDHIELTHLYCKGSGWGNEIWHMDREVEGWLENDYQADTWDHAVCVKPPSGVLTGQAPVGHHFRETLRPRSIERLAPNRLLLDFGQTITGRVRCRFTMRNARNAQLRLRHFDAWPRPNDFDQTDYWYAKSIAWKNAGVSVDWAPIYHLRCFRYVEVEYEGIEDVETNPEFEAEAIGNLPQRSAGFSCSQPLLNSIHEAGLRTLEALTIFGVVTDCTHREKDGWTGDGEANLDLSLSHYRVGDFYRRILQDCRDAQFDDGRIPYLIPYRRPKDSMCAGGPYYMGYPLKAAWLGYLFTGDRSFLLDNYEMCLRMIAFLGSHFEDGIMSVFPFAVGESEHGGEPRSPTFYLGDWLSPGKTAEAYEDNRLFNTAYLIAAGKLLLKIQTILGKDRQENNCLESNIRQWSNAVIDKYVNRETGVVGNGRQPAAVLVLLADILEPELRQKVYDRLKRRIIEEDQAHFDTGLMTSTKLLELLLKENDVDLAIKLLLATDYPSLGNFLQQGLTVFPEEWSGLDPETQSKYPAGQGKSYCHASFSGTVFWFLQALAGIQPDEGVPGFQRILLKPQFTKSLSWARGHMETPQGLIESSWKWRDTEALEWKITIPNGSEGRVVLPQGYCCAENSRLLPAGQYSLCVHSN